MNIIFEKASVPLKLQGKFSVMTVWVRVDGELRKVELKRQGKSGLEVPRNWWEWVCKEVKTPRITVPGI